MDPHRSEYNHGPAEESLRRAKQGRTWTRGGRFIGITGLAVSGWLQAEADLVGPFAQLAGVALTLAGVWAFTRGRKLQSVSAEARMLLDQRPPVLYLRSFKEDKAASGTPLAWALGRVSVLFGTTTEEEQLDEAMNEIGPLVAIGEPGEALPDLGASRLYVSHAEWKDRISDLMSRAQLLVLRAADTEGFWWEVKHAADTVGPERLMFLLPFNEKQYRRFCERAESLLPCALPPYQGGDNLIGSHLRAVLYFDRDWTPHIQTLVVRSSLSLTPLVTTLRRTLRPVIERLPSDARPAPASRRRAFAAFRTVPVVLFVLIGIPIVSFVSNRVLRSLSVQAHMARGLSLYERHEFDGAIRQYEQALRLDPKLVVAYSNLGLAWYQKGDLDRAYTEYGKALRLNQYDAVLRNNVGLVFLKRGDIALAVAEFRFAARTDPAIVAAHENLCDALARQNDLHAAVAECLETLRLNPSSASPHLVLGNVALLRGDFTGAIRSYREALRLSPALALAHNNLGFALRQTGKPEEAMSEYRKAIQLNPDLPEAHVNLGVALFSRGDWAGATIEFHTAVRSMPDSGVVHYHLGNALQRQGDDVEARKEFIKAYELAPDDSNIRRTYQQINRR